MANPVDEAVGRTLGLSAFGQLAGEDVNETSRLYGDPAMRWAVGDRAIQAAAASASQIGPLRDGMADTIREAPALAARTSMRGLGSGATDDSAEVRLG